MNLHELLEALAAREWECCSSGTAWLKFWHTPRFMGHVYVSFYYQTPKSVKEIVRRAMGTEDFYLGMRPCK